MAITEQSLDFHDNKPGGLTWTIVDEPGLQSIGITPRMPRIGARVFDESGHGVAAGATVFSNFNRIDYDTDGMFSFAHPNRLTVQTPGMYLTIGTVFGTTGGFPYFVYGSITKNGTGFVNTLYSTTMAYCDGANTGQVNPEQIWPMNAGDWFSLTAIFNYPQGAAPPNPQTLSIRQLSAQWLSPL
jgi:hypothetical protein